MSEIALEGGRLYLSRALYETYFAGLSAVVLLRVGDDLLILPVRQATAGGHLLKVRNAAGDRVVESMDFFRQNGFDALKERRLSALWVSERAGLLVEAAFTDLQTKFT